LGYGIWAFIDYHDNLICNSKFKRGLDAWDVCGDIESNPSLLEDKSTVVLRDNSSIKQTVSFPLYWWETGFFIEVTVSATSTQCPFLSIHINRKIFTCIQIGNDAVSSHTITVPPERLPELNIDVSGSIVLELHVSDGVIEFHNVRMYGYTHTSHVIHRDRSHGHFASALKLLNNRLLVS